MKNFDVGLMAGKFVTFGFIILIVSCALIVRAAEAAVGDDTNDEDFRGRTRGDIPVFIKEIDK